MPRTRAQQLWSSPAAQLPRQAKTASIVGRLWGAAGSATRAVGRAGSRVADELDVPVAVAAGVGGTHAYNQIVDEPMTGGERAASIGIPALLAASTRGRLQRARRAGQAINGRSAAGQPQLPTTDAMQRAYYNRPGVTARLGVPGLAAGVAPTATTNATGSQSMLANLQQSTNEFSNQLGDYWGAGKTLPEYLAGSVGGMAREQLKATLDDPDIQQRIRREAQPVIDGLREVGGGLAGSTAGAVLGNVLSRFIMPDKPGDKQLTVDEHNSRQRKRRLLSLVLSGMGAVGGYMAGRHVARPKIASTAGRLTRALTNQSNHTRRLLAKRAEQQKLAVEVVDRSRFQTPASLMSYTVGRLHPSNLMAGALLGTGRGIWDTSNPTDVAPLVEAYANKHEKHLQDVDPDEKPSATKRLLRWLTGSDPRGQGELMFSAGGPSPMKALGRVWSRPGISLPGRVLGTAGSLTASLGAAYQRGDNYDPWSHTVNSMANEPAIQAHELGHAADFSRMRHPTAYALLYSVPFVNLFHEARASVEAPKLLAEAREIHERAREADPESAEMNEVTTYDKILGNEARADSLLSAAYGTYLGSAIGRALMIPGDAPIIVTALVGRLLGYLGKPWSRLSGAQRKQVLEEASEIAESGITSADDQSAEEKVIQLAERIKSEDEGDTEQRKAAAAEAVGGALAGLISGTYGALSAKKGSSTRRRLLRALLFGAGGAAVGSQLGAEHRVRGAIDQRNRAGAAVGGDWSDVTDDLRDKEDMLHATRRNAQQHGGYDAERRRELDLRGANLQADRRHALDAMYAALKHNNRQLENRVNNRVWRGLTFGQYSPRQEEPFVDTIGREGFSDY